MIKANKLTFEIFDEDDMTEIVDSLDGINYLVVFHKYIRGSVESKKLIKDASNVGIPYQIVGSSF